MSGSASSGRLILASSVLGIVLIWGWVLPAIGTREAVRASVQRLERQNTTAFSRFDQLQKELVVQSQAVKLRRDEWADEAFAPVDSIFGALIKQTGREIVEDTTDATGIARVVVKPGKWWVHARYDLPYTELYWNIPVEVQRGEPVQVKLTRETAEIRRKL